MIVSVRESKARLSELLAKALEGEEVVITVRGEPKARLLPVKTSAGKPDLRSWAADRRRILEGQAMGTDSSGEILDELREDRF